MAAETRETLLIQFAREPVPGQVKTRMFPHLSADQACELHCDLVQWTAQQLLASGLGPVQLAVAGDPGQPLFTRSLNRGVSELVEQRGEDLGERMFHALAEALESFRRVILVGSDCPSIDGAYLAAAVESLQRVPVVLGPALDGGYVLIGATRVDRQLFAGITWGSEQVMSQTRERLEQLRWDYEELASLADVDRPADLPAWEALRCETA
jgi:rSAM/selenodomain-associated transferase 1